MAPPVSPQAEQGDVRRTFLPPPVLGYSSIQPRWGGDPRYASSYQNFYTYSGVPTIRGGSSQWATRSAAGTVSTLVQYQPNLSANAKLFACTETGVYDVTAGGSYSATLLSRTNGYTQWASFTTPGGTNYLIGANGIDSVTLYDGSTWTSITGVSTPAITGVTTANLNYVWLFKRRLFFLEKNSMNAWFLPVDSIAGVASKFPLGPLFTRGGYILSGFTWTLDGGNGPDDYCGFVSSEGEVAVYQGTDPTTSTAWGLIGVFYVGKPASCRCWVRIGGDILIATEIGLISLRQTFQGKEATPQNALSRQIWTDWKTSWKAAVVAGYNPTTWCVTLYPAQGAIIVNVPSQFNGADPYQYVYNLDNGSWSTFKNWAAFHFVVFKGDLYYGTNYSSNGFVVKCWTTDSTDWYKGATQAVGAQLTQVPQRLAGQYSFDVELIRPRLGTYNALDDFNGTPLTTGPSRWYTYLPAINNQPRDTYAPIWDAVGASANMAYYGVDVQYRVLPGGQS